MPTNIRQILNKDPEYPTLLTHIHSPPQRLWLRGAKLKDDTPHLTVVGTRNPTPYGKKVTTQLVQELASSGLTIVSGLALGIDGLAHKAALDVGGHTIAVLANGVDKVHPATNQHIARRILDSGGTILSDYPPGTPPLPYHFVARNRIQSGLSDAVLVIEAAEKSGTLITAQFALEQGRVVMAVPGNIDSPTSTGTNKLIQDGAIPVTSAKDVLEALGLSLKSAEVLKYKPENPSEEVLIKLITRGLKNSEELQLEAKLPVIEFNTTLTLLEIKGVVHQYQPGYWDFK